MTMRRLQNVLAQTEFSGFTGDCTEDALDTALHSAFPNEFPVTAAELNALTNQAKSASPAEAGSQGSMDPAQLAWLIGQLHDPTGAAIPFSQSTTPNWSDYTTFTATFQSLVQQWGGIRPMVIQLAHGEWLPGSWSNPSGPAVGHAIALTAFDPATGAAEIADGNSSYGGNGQVSPTDLATLSKALPYAVTVLNMDAQNTAQEGTSVTISISDPTVAKFFALQASGEWKCLQNGNLIGGGILAAYQALPALGSYAGLSDLGLPISGRIFNPGGHAGIEEQYFERGGLRWDPSRVMDSPPGVSGSVYRIHVEQGTMLAFLEASLQTQLTAAKQAQAAAQSAAQQAQDALATAQAQIASDATAAEALQQQLTAAEAQASQAAQNLAAANQQVTALQAQLQQAQADAAKGATLVEALKAALA